MKKRLIFLINSAQQQKFKVSQFTGHFVCLNLRIEFRKYSIITVFKHEESVKTGVDSTHTQGTCGEDLINLPTVGVSHSPAIDAEYVFVSLNIVTILGLL